jgi:hypothetical protein
MYQFFLVLRDICQLRRGPQDLPYSLQLLLVICAATLLLQLVVALGFGIGGDTFIAGVSGLLLNLGVLYLLLSLRGLGSRFVQTAMAWLGSAFFFMLLLLPVEFLIVDPSKPPAQPTPLQGLLVLAALAILAWKLVVDAHILRHSLNLTFFGGMAVAVLWFVIAYTLLILISNPMAAG